MQPKKWLINKLPKQERIHHKTVDGSCLVQFYASKELEDLIISKCTTKQKSVKPTNFGSCIIF
jgi:hypothetical protein